MAQEDDRREGRRRPVDPYQEGLSDQAQDDPAEEDRGQEPRPRDRLKGSAVPPTSSMGATFEGRVAWGIVMGFSPSVRTTTATEKTGSGKTP